MRIISGKYRGTKLFLPPDDLIRPTSDRAKEMNIWREEWDRWISFTSTQAGAFE